MTSRAPVNTSHTARWNFGIAAYADSAAKDVERNYMHLRWHAGLKVVQVRSLWHRSAQEPDVYVASIIIHPKNTEDHDPGVHFADRRLDVRATFSYTTAGCRTAR